MGLFTKSSTADNLAQEANNVSSTGSLSKIKAWWDSKSTTEKAIILGILVAAGSAPAWIIYAKGMTITTFVPEATGGLWEITQAAPLWSKIFVASSGIILSGVITAKVYAMSNGDSVEQILKDNNIK